MIKMFMTSGEDFILDLENEAKEIDLIYKFHSGLDLKSTLKVTVEGKITRIKASEINNMQFMHKEPKKVAPDVKKKMEQLADNFAWNFLHGGKA